MDFITLKLFFRNLKRDKLISFINIFGLVAGILSALFILEYVYYERSYDSHHEHADNIYRLAYNRYDGDKLMWETANSFFPAGAWLKDNYSEVINQSRITPKHNITISYQDDKDNKVFFKEPRAFYGTTSMFEVFTIPLIQGNSEDLEKPFTVAISARAAHKYFGTSNPIGKVLQVNGSEDYAVCAVYENIPSNSIVRTDFMFSMETFYHFRPGLRTVWGYDYGTTYLYIKPGTDQLAFAEKALPKMVEDNYKARLDRMNKRDVFYLQPLRKIHLNSNIEYESVPAGNGKIISILWGFALFLLIIAWINYINLMTARAVDRAREIGVRKVNGASRLTIIGQFIREAFLFNLLCIFIAAVLFAVLNPLYKSVIDIEGFSLFAYNDFIVTGIIVFVVGIVASCLYPAFVLQSYKPAVIFKGTLKHSGHGFGFRKSLLVLQFLISAILLSGTIISNRQAKFLMNKEMGVDLYQSLVISAPETGESKTEIYKKLLVLKDEVRKDPQVADFTITSDVPLREIETWFGCRRKGFDASDQNGYFQIAVDDQFIDFFKVRILAGRKFFEGEQDEAGNVLMNQMAIERMGIPEAEDAVNTMIISRERELKVVGVVDDFHYKSIKNEPVPTVITLNNKLKKFLILKLANNANQNISVTLAQLQKKYNNVFPDQPFDYYLLDDKAQMDLKPDSTFSLVFGLFSSLAIIIAVIGIVGLILIIISQRMKEIGIRKVLGSTLVDGSTLLMKEVSMQFIIAVLISIPLSFYGFQKWFLDSYLYSIEVQFWMILMPVISLFIIIFLVIHKIAVNAYKMNVTEVLQNE